MNATTNICAAVLHLPRYKLKQFDCSALFDAIHSFCGMDGLINMVVVRVYNSSDDGTVDEGGDDIISDYCSGSICGYSDGTAGSICIH